MAANGIVENLDMCLKTGLLFLAYAMTSADMDNVLVIVETYVG